MSSIYDNISALFRGCGLGEVRGEIQPVSGGLMHKMYRVEAESGVYAVKSLNSAIMKRPGVFENYAKAEALEKILEENALPIVPALTFGGRKMLECGGGYYYIFRWQEGQITDWHAITAEQCFRAGEILGRMHGIDPKDAEAQEVTESAVDFKGYAKLAAEKHSVIAETLEENLTLLETAQEKLNEARHRLPAMSAIDDADLDPKNIMWHEGKPRVIDLECLDYGNPAASCLNLALQWAGTVTENYSSENLEAFFRGYLGVYDNAFRSYDGLFGIAYTWVEWLEYNIRRALSLEGGDEAELGEKETVNTIRRMRYLSSLEAEICGVLRNLPAPAGERQSS